MKKIHPILLFIILLPIGGLVDNFLDGGFIANPFLARGVSRIAWIVIGVLVGMRVHANQGRLKPTPLGILGKSSQDLTQQVHYSSTGTDLAPGMRVRQCAYNGQMEAVVECVAVYSLDEAPFALGARAQLATGNDRLGFDNISGKPDPAPEIVELRLVSPIYRHLQDEYHEQKWA